MPNIPDRPIKGTRIDNYNFCELWDYIRTLSLKGDGKTVRVNHTYNGTTISAINNESESGGFSDDGDDTNGYFKITSEDNIISIIDGHDIDSENCGYISTGEELLPVLKSVLPSITEDSFIVLNVDLQTISTQDMTDEKIFGVLLGRAYYTLSEDESTHSLEIVQEHTGLVYTSISSDFEVISTSINSVNIGTGKFIINHLEQTLDSTSLSVTESGTIYITATEDTTPTVHIGTLPEYSKTIAYIPIADVYFDGEKITKIEQFVRNKFHCHTWESCDEVEEETTDV